MYLRAVVRTEARASATGYPMTSPAPATAAQNNSATTTPTAVQASKSCATIYLIQPEDDCHSISHSQQVSTAEMLCFKNLEAGCTHFPDAGTDLYFYKDTFTMS
ncbi:hypothetical protein N7523_005064 [Penicillium sp. IBT 18751x]|nr:hypothetical protein N7523_005064 [Penicillium sp. IBT 18751x]